MLYGMADGQEVRTVQRIGLWVICVIFLALGVLLNGLTYPVSAGNEIPRPKIVIKTMYLYADQQWEGEFYDLKGSSATLTGDEYYLSVKFDRPMNEESVMKGIQLIGYKDPIMRSYSKASNEALASFKNVQAGKEYTLSIAKTVKDENGNSLKSDIKIKLVFKEYTRASYSLIGDEDTYTQLQNKPGVEPADVGEMHITNSPKRFIVDFTNDVNRTSVEKSLTLGLERAQRELLDTAKLTTRLKWLNNRKLQIDLSGFPTDREAVYTISMESAVDKFGYRIVGDLTFATAEANRIGYIDLDSKKETTLVEMKDKRYMVHANPNIQDYIILDNGRNRHIYNLRKKGIVDSLEASLFFDEHQVDWFSPEMMFLYKASDREMKRLSLRDGSVTAVVSLAFLGNQPQVAGFSLSPDKKKFVVFADGDGLDDRMFDMLVYSIDGKLLLHAKDFVKVFGREMIGVFIYHGWLDNRYIIAEESMYQVGRNLVTLDTSLGTKKSYLKSGSEPAALAGKNLLRYFREQDGRYIFVKNGHTIDLKYPDVFTKNHFFVDESRVVFNRGDQIILYDFDKRGETVLGQGTIFGISADRKRVYYMTNFRGMVYQH